MSVFPNVALGELMCEGNTNIDPRRYEDEQFALYSIPAFDTGVPDNVAGRQIGSAKQLVQKDDVMLSRIVPHIRRAWVVGAGDSRRQVASSEWIIFRSKRIEPTYLRHVLLSDDFHARFMMTVAGVGGSLMRARPKHVAEINIPFPSIGEQRRIAKILDQADSLRVKRREVIIQLDSLRRAIFLDMFGDPEENTNAFSEERLGNLLLRKPNFGSMQSPKKENLPWLSLRVSNIKNWDLDLSDSKFIKLSDDDVDRFSLCDGDIILARAIASQEHLGKCVIVRPGEKKWSFDSHIVRLRVDQKRLLPTYIQSLLQTPGGRRIFLRLSKKTTVQFNINISDISMLKFPLPPISLQNEYERRLLMLSHLVQNAKVSARQTNSLFASLQHRAFTGAL